MTRDNNIGERLSVGELIEILQQFPKDMGVVAAGFGGITQASIKTLVCSNHPYDTPETDYVMLD